MLEKFTFKELTSDLLVRSLKPEESIDDKIREAVISHLTTLIEESEEKKLEHNESHSTTNDEISEISENTNEVKEELSTYETKPEEHHRKAIYSEHEIKELEKIFFERGKNKGAEEMKLQLDTRINELESNLLLYQNLSTKLNQLAPSVEPTTEYVDLISSFLEELLEKVIVALPTDFTKIINTQLSNIIDSGYQGGKITIRVNANQTHLVEKILQNSELALKIDKFEVIPDTALTESDCCIELSNSKLIYDKSLVIKEIDEIIKQFKLDS